MEQGLTFVNTFAEYGPEWMIAAAIIALGIWVVYKIVRIYEKNLEDRLNTQSDMVKISGQMVEQMDRSNSLLETVQKELTAMNAQTQALINSLEHSQDRSTKMGSDVATILDRVNFLYQRLIGVDQDHL